MSQLLHGLQTGALGEIGTVAFVVAFLAACAYVFTLSKGDRDALKYLPLDNLEEERAAKAPPADLPGDGAPGPAPAAPHPR